MCDYSLNGIASRPARVGDRIVSTRFAATFDRGFGLLGARDIAICLMPGTEIAFDGNAVIEPELLSLPKWNIGECLARFRHVNHGDPLLPRDAVEFIGGEIVPVMRLAEGQVATVIQLPSARAASPEQMLRAEPA